MKYLFGYRSGVQDYGWSEWCCAGISKLDYDVKYSRKQIEKITGWRPEACDYYIVAH